MSEKLKRIIETGDEDDLEEYIELKSNSEILDDIRKLSRMDEALRDHFAGLAMQAIVSQAKLNPCGDFVADDCLLQHHKAPKFASATAYQFADAMLAARKGAAHE